MSVDRTHPTAASTPEDLALAARLRANDESAREQVLRTHLPGVYATCHRLLGGREVAEATRDAFASALAAIETYDGSLSLSAWLRRAAIAEAMRRGASKDAPAEANAEASTGGSRTTGRTASAMRAALERLPDPLRIVVLLRDGEGLSCPEVGDLLGIPTAEVRTRLRSARTRLTSSTT
jgi:RNA polymerase sigma-70 factor (ECF subfamily)